MKSCIFGIRSCVFASVFFAGCNWGGSAGSNPPPEIGTLSSALIAVESCDDLVELLKQREIEVMEAIIEGNKQQMLSAMEGGDDCWLEYENDDMASGDGSGTPTDSNGGGDSASDYSETNNQVAGVDEADFVKNDGAYIYILADGRFQIVDAWPAEQAHKISDVAIEGTPTKMFVHEDKAVVYSSGKTLNQGGYDEYGDMGMPDDGYGYSECTYGYNCDFTGDGRALKMTVLDISDKTSPVILRTVDFDGSLLSARRIGDAVFSVVTFPEQKSTEIIYWPEELSDYRWGCYDDVDLPFSTDEVTAYFDSLVKSNTALIEEAEVGEYLPVVTDSMHDGNLFAGCDGFYMSTAGDGQRFLTLAGFDLASNGALDTTTVVAKPGAVYANKASLYVAVRHYRNQMDNWYFSDGEQIQEATTVHKFGLAPGQIDSIYQGSGVVKGRVLNQFAMDDKDDYLRIATTTGHLPDPDTHNTISVLFESAGHLNTVGIVDNIAPTEDIRSVRFDGDLGFMVTFKKTDPLFVIDLSDPTAPQIKGELKIPGYSTYMHLMDEKHLLTIGYDASDQGDFAWFTGIQLQIMDVSDVTNPKLVHKEVIGTRGTSSEAATNHLAFNYYPTRDYLALPMTICEGGDGDGSYGYEMSFNGLVVYEVTANAGFSELGGVPHAQPSSGDDYYSTCGSWWTDSNTTVKRSIFMENFVYSVALDKINVADVGDLDSVMVSIPLTH